ASAQEATDDEVVSETETPISDEIVEKDEPSSETPSDGAAAETEAGPAELLVAAPVQSHAQSSPPEPVAEARSENPLQSVDARHFDATSAQRARSDDTEVVSPRTLPAAAQESAASPTNAPAATESASEQSER